MTIIIRIDTKTKLKFNKTKQLDLFRIMSQLNILFKTRTQYHEHPLNESCVDICKQQTINRMGFG